jgi:hypothetical protein
MERLAIGLAAGALRQELLRHLGVITLPGGRIEVRAAQPTGSNEAFIGRLASHEDHA